MNKNRTSVARKRIVVADDNPGFLKELISLLTLDFEIVASAVNGRIALELIRYHKPDAAVLDLYMPLLNGIEVARQLARDVPRSPVVICSAETDPEIIKAARQAGALGYVCKMRMRVELVPTVKLAARKFSDVRQYEETLRAATG